MKNRRIVYIELKTGFSDNGPAWIAEVEYSKTGQTLYFDDRALKKLKIPGIGTNHFDIETGEDYWVTGVKKNGHNRHQYGSGKIMIDSEIVDEYLSMVDFTFLNERHFEIVELNKKFDKTRFNSIENNPKSFSEDDSVRYSIWYWDKNKRKLVVQ